MDNITVYDVTYVLPLSLNRTAHILNQTNEHEELIHQVILTPVESAVLALLLDHAPRMCSYEEVMRVFGGEAVQVQGRSQHERDTLLAPLRNALAVLNGKLTDFNLEILAVYETGYLLHARVGDIPFSLFRQAFL